MLHPKLTYFLDISATAELPGPKVKQSLLARCLPLNCSHASTDSGTTTHIISLKGLEHSIQ
jgi:hypothetical protein